MKINLRRLYVHDTIKIHEEINIPKEKYEPSGIKNITYLVVKGIVFINSSENIELSVNVKGTLILPCANSLKNVNYNLDININEEVLDLNNNNNQVYLELSDIIWENILQEVPLKITKENRNKNDFKKEGRELK